MRASLNRVWWEQDGVLSFEWALLLTLLVLGIVGGLAAARDAILDEFGDVAQAMLSVDHSMTISFPLQVITHNPSDPSSASDSSFIDAMNYTDCTRNDFLPGQAPQLVEDVDS